MADLKPTEFLRFEELPNDGMKTRRFMVRSMKHQDALGTIHWFGRWRQYAFQPVPGSVFNNECLTDIADRLSYLNVMQHGAIAGKIVGTYDCGCSVIEHDGRVSAICPKHALAGEEKKTT